MSRKRLEVPLAVARSFVEGHARSLCREKSSLKKDEIAARQLWLLKQHYPGKLRITDAREMFVQVRDEVLRGGLLHARRLR